MYLFSSEQGVGLINYLAAQKISLLALPTATSDRFRPLYLAGHFRPVGRSKNSVLDKLV